MYLLSGRDIRRAATTHSRTVGLIVTQPLGKVLTETELPSLTDGTINFTPNFPRRKISLKFETQNPSQEFLNLLKANNTSWQVFLDGLPQGVYYLRDFSIDDPGKNRNYRLYLSDESMLFAENRTEVARTYSGDLIEVCEEILEGTGRTIQFRGVRNAGILLESVFLDVDKDPWAEVTVLLGKYGYEIFMDREGYCIIRQVPEPGRVFAKSLDSLVLAEQETQVRRAVNRIVVVSTNSGVAGEQYKAEVVDDNPWSDTYYYGDASSATVQVSVRGLTSNEHCLEVAESLKPVYFNRKRSKVFTMLQVPKLDFGESFIAADKLYKVDQISYSLVTYRPMYLTSRGQPLALQP